MLNRQCSHVTPLAVAGGATARSLAVGTVVMGTMLRCPVPLRLCVSHGMGWGVGSSLVPVWSDKINCRRTRRSGRPHTPCRTQGAPVEVTHD